MSAGGLGFGSGIAQGLSKALLRHSAEQREDRLRKEKESREAHLAMMPFAMKQFEETGNAAALQSLWKNIDPDIAKQFEKQGSPFEMLAPVLSGGRTAREDVAGVDQAISEGTPLPLPSTQKVGISAPGKDRWFFGGAPMESAEDQQTRQTEAQFRLAARLYQQQHAADPEFTMEDARRAVRIPVAPINRALRPQSVAGELLDGTPAYAVFNPELQKYLDPETQQPIEGFRPRTTTASTSLGQVPERAAKLLGFRNATEAFKAGKGPELQAKIEEVREADAKASGVGTGRARIQTELNSPIGPTAAKEYNVPPTTTLAELAKTNGLSAAQVEKIAALSQVDELLTGIEAGIDTVFPEVQPGVWGRIKSQLSLGAQILSADEDLAALDSAINAALAQVAQLSGQPGSRLSDTDLRLAESTLAELKPSIFGGDTRATAKARLGVLRRLLEKAKSNAPTRTSAPRAPLAGQQTAPPGPATGLTIGPDGKYYMDGVLLPTQP